MENGTEAEGVSGSGYVSNNSGARARGNENHGANMV